MAQDHPNAREQLTPEERRTLLRAFGDRMLMKLTAMDDPKDLAEVERSVRVGAVIERLYSRCDRTEHTAPDPRKRAAERAQNESEAIQAQADLAKKLEWESRRRKDLGSWWDAAQDRIAPPITAAKPVATPAATPAPETPTVDTPRVDTPSVDTPDVPTYDIDALRAEAIRAGLEEAQSDQLLLFDPDEIPHLIHPKKLPPPIIIDMTDAFDRARAEMGLPPDTDHPALSQPRTPP